MIVFVGEKFSIEHNIINMFLFNYYISSRKKMISLKKDWAKRRTFETVIYVKKERNDYNSKAEKILLYKGDVTGKIVGLIEYTARGIIFLA